MSLLKTLFVAMSLGLMSAFGSAAIAGANDPLFVNATTDEPHRASMALTFSNNQLERSHPVTIFLNDRGVMIGSKANAKKFKDQQALLQKLLAGGATVLVCPMCMKHYGVKDADLLDGLRVGSPEATGAALFQDNARTMSW